MPTSFVISFLVLTYLSSRPCPYCSALLVVLFISSCSWANHCFFDFRGNWFEPRHFSSPLPNPLPHATNWTNSGAETKGTGSFGELSFLATAVNETVSALAGAAAEEVKERLQAKPQWTGIGINWFRAWLGKRQWRLPCLDVHVRL